MRSRWWVVARSVHSVVPSLTDGRTSYHAACSANPNPNPYPRTDVPHTTPHVVPESLAFEAVR